MSSASLGEGCALEGCKGHTHKGHMEKVLILFEFQDVFLGCFQGVCQGVSGYFQGVFGGDPTWWVPFIQKSHFPQFYCKKWPKNTNLWGFSCFQVFSSFFFLPFFALVSLLSLCFSTSWSLKRYPPGGVCGVFFPMPFPGMPFGPFQVPLGWRPPELPRKSPKPETHILISRFCRVDWGWVFCLGACPLEPRLEAR